MEIPCSSRVCARNILEDNFSDNSKSNKSNMHFYLSLTLLLAAFVARKVEGSNSNQTADKMVKQPGVVERFNPSYNRWDNDAAENELGNSRIRSSHRSQQEYSCGRAVSQQKYKDTLRDQNYHMAMTRPKYRPIEIRMPRVIGGDETVPGEFPWTVSVKLNGQPICGGSLIERNWILTAAHCVVGYNPKNLTIRLGAYRIKDSSETQTVDLEVSMFVVHKDYSMPRPFSNDIALLKLSEPVEFTDFIIPICLPKEDQATPSGVVNEDYMNKIDSNKEEESSGIVFSTKMSDSDIADCFNKLEQNYLNSIGLGTSAESTTERNIQETPPATNRPITNRPISYSNTVDPAIFMSTNNKNKITFMSSQNPGQSFELPFSLDTSSMDAYAPNGYILYGLPWNRKEIGGKDGRKDAFKLSRLPINKELLKEIQSIGSGPMPSLNLGLQQEFASVPDNIVLGNSHSSIVKPANLESIRTPFQSLHDQVDTPSEYSGLKGIVVGWGWIREHDGEDQMNNKGYPSVTLQKVELPILRNNVCEAWFQSQAKKITLLPSQFCAGFNSGGKDACRGDSGGPMIIEDNADSGRYKLIGIVSAGIGCARPSLPGLYTKVASFIPWINAQITRY